jgi:hypothetical protein
MNDLRNVEKVYHCHRFYRGEGVETFFNNHVVFPFYVPIPNDGDLVEVRSCVTGEEMSLVVSNVMHRYQINGNDCHITSSMSLESWMEDIESTEDHKSDAEEEVQKQDHHIPKNI